MRTVHVCDAIRTPIGRYAGALSSVRTDDLAAIPIRALMARSPKADWNALDEVVLGCANQAGEDNRNVARMALLLAGLPARVPGVTVNRLCASGLEAIASAARTVAIGDADLIIAGGVESMSRAPLVLAKPTEPFARQQDLHDTTIGWRFINPRMRELYGVDALPETAENVARERRISRTDQDAFALRSQQRAAAAVASGRMAREITPVSIRPGRADPTTIAHDEHPRATTPDALAKLRPITSPDGTITAGNASGVNDGAAAVLLASESALARHGLTPRARILGSTTAGVEPRVMGLGPIPAVRKLLDRLALGLGDFDLLEFNEAFAAQVLACTRELGVPDDDPRLNPLGGAIALGHPLGMSGARLLATSMHQLAHDGRTRALCAMCVGVGQGMALALARG